MASCPGVPTAARALAGLCFALLLVPASPVAAADTKAFAATSDFSTGGLSVVDLATRAVSQDVSLIHPDAVLRYHDGLLHVVNRFGADNIQVIDPTSYATLRQFSVGNGTNPQDIVFLSRALVSRYGSNSLLVVDPSLPDGGPDPKPTISLAPYADADGIPEMARMIVLYPRVFIACQRLTNFNPVNTSMVVAVDVGGVNPPPPPPQTQGIPLSLKNPVTTFEYDRVNGRLWIGCAGAFGSLDGGVEAIHPGLLMSDGVKITEAQLGGDIIDVIWYSATRAFALVGTGSHNQLVTWNPSTGLKTGTLFTANGGFSLPDMALNDRGELYVCKNPFPVSGTDLPGLLVFNAATGALLAGPLDTGLPPVAVTFDRADDQVLDVAPAPHDTRVALQGPWPNPARTSTRLALSLERASEVEVRVLDVAGRRVRTLFSGALGSGPHTIAWDLADGSGRRAPAGVYLVEARIAGAVTTRKLALVD